MIEYHGGTVYAAEPAELEVFNHCVVFNGSESPLAASDAAFEYAQILISQGISLLIIGTAVYAHCPDESAGQ